MAEPHLYQSKAPGEDPCEYCGLGPYTSAHVEGATRAARLHESDSFQMWAARSLERLAIAAERIAGALERQAQAEEHLFNEEAGHDRAAPVPQAGDTARPVG